jgi:hypothetical protein
MKHNSSIQFVVSLNSCTWLSNAIKLEFPCEYNIWRTEKTINSLVSNLRVTAKKISQIKDDSKFSAAFSFKN